MIKYEHNMLVLSAALTKEDQQAINDFIVDVKKQDRQAILRELEKVEEQSARTRTPLYQDTLFKVVKDIVAGNKFTAAFPPASFRDIANGE